MKTRRLLSILAATVQIAGGPSRSAATTVSTAPAQWSGEALIGLWGTRVTFPETAGELEVVRRGSAWRASLGKTSVAFQSDGGVIEFRLPGSTAGFQGSLDPRTKTIRGFWLQTAHGDGANGLSGADQPFASPIILASARRGVWRGAVRPLPDTLTLFVEIHRTAGGELVGEVRNPEFNFNGGASQYSVRRDGDSVIFGSSPDGSPPKEAFRMRLLHAPDRLRVAWPELKVTYELRRLGPSEANRFYPRPRGEPPYVYAPPPQEDDGWRTARAQETGMDEAALQRLVRRLIAIDPATRRPPLIHSILVAHGGKLVLEEYFFGYAANQPHDMRSAAKTFASVLLGTAMLDGVPIAPEDSVYRLMARLGPFDHPDPRKAQITLAQLLTHTSGLACDDNDDSSPGAENNLQAQTAQPNWIKYTLDLPMAHDPGVRYAYCSAGINLVGGALAASSGHWLPELFDQQIAKPLQFGRYYWNLAPDGAGYLGGGAFIRPRDLLKIGQVYLDGGVWRGRRIVTADWVERSTGPKVTISPETTGLSQQAFSEVYFKGEDGFAWHVGKFTIAGRDHLNYAATGNGGQLLIVAPDYDLAVAFTAGNYGQGGIWNRFRTEIVLNEIIPAIDPPSAMHR